MLSHTKATGGRPHSKVSRQNPRGRRAGIWRGFCRSFADGTLDCPAMVQLSRLTVAARHCTLVAAGLLAVPSVIHSRDEQQCGLDRSDFAPQSPSVVEKQDVPEIVRSVSNSIVQVIVSDASANVLSRGSGFIVSTDGKVVTNYHVIVGGTTFVIKFPNGAFYEVAGVLAADKERDLVILKAVGSDFKPVRLGDSDKVVVGESVVAIGSPLALESTVSTGIISGIRTDGKLKYLQTTTPVSKGSSGGALLNSIGEVIGVTTWSVKPAQNINFAVPINDASSLIATPADEPLRIGADPRCKVDCGTIRLRVSPSSAKVIVNGWRLGTVGELGGSIKLQPGEHVLELNAEGHEGVRRTIEVRQGWTTTERATLRRKSE